MENEQNEQPLETFFDLQKFDTLDTFNFDNQFFNNKDLPPYGYENVGFKDTNVIYDSCLTNELMQQINGPKIEFQSIPILTEDESKDALTKYTNSKYRFGKRSLKEMITTDIQSSVSYHYVLKSFYESRSVKWTFEPYNGYQTINYNARSILPWEVNIEPKALFKNDVIHCNVPNTDRIRNCHKCSGAGKFHCSKCHGRGKKNCNICGGGGNRMIRAGLSFKKWDCMICSGNGYTNCSSCSSTGHHLCNCCNGTTKLRWNIILTIKFETQVDEYIKKSEVDIPNELLSSCKNISVFSEINRIVCPLNHFDDHVNKVCLDLLKFQLNKLAGTRILMQQHSLFAIPVTLCKYKFNNNDYQYHIFGTDNQVYITGYPQDSLLCLIS